MKTEKQIYQQRKNLVLMQKDNIEKIIAIAKAGITEDNFMTIEALKMRNETIYTQIHTIDWVLGLNADKDAE